MAVAQRHEGVGQYGFGQHHPMMGPPSSSFNNNINNSFGYDRRPKMDDAAEPLWPVPRVQQQQQPPLQAGNVNDRPFSGGLAQPDFGRPQGHQPNYTYNGSSSTAPLRNPVVYSQGAPVGWGLGGPSSGTHYPEYPTASYMAPLGQRALPPPMQGHAQPYLGGGSTNGAYGDSSLHPLSDTYPKVMSAGPGPSMGTSSYDHTADTLWPLGPNSLDAFAGIPAPARLTLTTSSAVDKLKLKSRSNLPLPKQFKCSACDAIFSRNHDLKRHARIHLAVKPFPCGYCDKAFSRKDALKRHVLVKGCGIGNKKSGEQRKRAATLSKLEGSDGASAGRPLYDGVPSSREFGGFREEVGYQGQQGEAGSSRGFAGGSWPSTLTDPSSQQSAEYPSPPNGGERGGPQMAQSYGSQAAQPQQQAQAPYSNFGMTQEDAFQQQQASSQRQQLAGGLVNAFTSPAGTSASSPTESQAKYAMSGANHVGVGGEGEARSTSRQGSAVPFPGQAYPAAGNMGLGVAAVGEQQQQGAGGFGGSFDAESKQRFGYAQQPMLSPSSLGHEDVSALKRHHQQQQQQQQFNSYLNNATH